MSGLLRMDGRRCGAQPGTAAVSRRGDLPTPEIGSFAVLGTGGRVTRGIDLSTQGLVVPSTVSGAIDVLLDGQRVWSFNPGRDGTTTRGRHVSVPWPKALRPRLDGVADVELVDHVTREVLHTSTVRFGTGSGRIRVVDGDGNPLAVDKGG